MSKNLLKNRKLIETPELPVFNVEHLYYRLDQDSQINKFFRENFVTERHASTLGLKIYLSTEDNQGFLVIRHEFRYWNLFNNKIGPYQLIGGKLQDLINLKDFIQEYSFKVMAYRQFIQNNENRYSNQIYYSNILLCRYQTEFKNLIKNIKFNINNPENVEEKCKDLMQLLKSITKLLKNNKQSKKGSSKDIKISNLLMFRIYPESLSGRREIALLFAGTIRLREPEVLGTLPFVKLLVDSDLYDKVIDGLLKLKLRLV